MGKTIFLALCCLLSIILLYSIGRIFYEGKKYNEIKVATGTLYLSLMIVVPLLWGIYFILAR